jgi:hypothetical protein
MAFKREKFKRLVHYIIWKAGKRDWFGAVKLNKVLWFSDTEAFAHTGEPITGARYIREKYGPVPKAIMPVRSELERDGSIRIWREGKVERAVADVAPDMRQFSSSEMAIVDWWMASYPLNYRPMCLTLLSQVYCCPFLIRPNEPLKGEGEPCCPRS